MKKTITALLVAAGAFGTLAACDSNDGPAEEIGEDIDDAAEEIEDSTE